MRWLQAHATAHAPPCPAPRSRTGALYALFSLACTCGLVLLLAQLFNYPLGLKVKGWPWSGIHCSDLRLWCGDGALAALCVSLNHVHLGRAPRRS